MKHPIHSILISREFILIQIILFVILSNILLSNIRCKMDLSRNGRFKLTSSTEKILTNLHNKLYIDAYYSSEIPPEYLSRIEMVKELLQEIADVSPNTVKLRFYDPDKSDKDRERAIQSGIDPQTLQKVDIDSTEMKSAFLGLKLTMGKESDVVPVAFFAEDVEYQVLSLVKKMIRREKNMTSGVAILMEPGSITAPRPNADLGKDTFGLFINQIFSSEYGIAYPIRINSEPIPVDISVLIIAGCPELTDLGRFHIDQFLMKGGKILYLSKTMEFEIEDNSSYAGLGLSKKGFAQVLQNTKDLNEFFSHYGFNIGSDMVLDPTNSMPMGPIVQFEDGVYGRYYYPLWILARSDKGQLSKVSPFTRDLEVLLLPWASSITVIKERQPNAKFQSIILSSKNAFVKENYLFIGEKEVHSLEGVSRNESITLGLHIKGHLNSYYIDREIPPSKRDSDIFLESSINNSLSENEKIPEILIVSSPYIVSDILVKKDFREIYQGANAPFLLNAIDILQGDEEIIQSRTKKPAYEPLEVISKTEEIFYSIINVVVIPTALGIFAFIRIRNRNLGIREE